MLLNSSLGAQCDLRNRPTQALFVIHKSQGRQRLVMGVQCASHSIPPPKSNPPLLARRDRACAQASVCSSLTKVSGEMAQARRLPSTPWRRRDDIWSSSHMRHLSGHRSLPWCGVTFLPMHPAGSAGALPCKDARSLSDHRGQRGAYLHPQGVPDLD